MMPDSFNAFLVQWEESAEGPGSQLGGLSVAIKDNICVRGYPCTCGSRMLDGWVPPYDATVVKRVRAAGGVIAGKTNLDEFGMGSSTEHSAFGPTLNPHDRQRVPGGSSGGSAVAVAAGLADLALGSDTGGSVRQPASFCGIVGLKPTYGLVSRYGLVAYASSLDQIGPMSRTVVGNANLLSVIAGHDERDSTSIEGLARVDYANCVGRGVQGLRVGLVREFLGDGVAPDVEHVVRSAADRLADDGAVLIDVSVPAFSAALSAYYLIASAEASSNLARFDGVRYGRRIEGDTAEQMMIATRTAGFGMEVKRRVLLGTFALSAGYHDQFYGNAQRARTLLIRDLSETYGEVDVLLGPTSPVPPFHVGEKLQDPLSMYMMDVCTVPANLAGHPAISVPAGVDRDGLPIGAQLMAPALREDLLFAVAGAIEARSGMDAVRILPKS